MDETCNYQWRIAQRPEGKPKPQDFRLTQEEIPRPGKSEALLKTLYLGLAPVMRMYMQGLPAAGEQPLAVGDVIHGRGVAEVVESRHPDYKPGDILQGQIGWQSYKVSKITPSEKFFRCPDLGLSYAHFLAALGMPGLSAWAGFTDCGHPREGDVTVVSGAAGGVGSIVVQIAKLMGCRVIGITGGPEKCAWLKDLGVDETIDYRNQDVDAGLAALCPQGLDIYFDNVGGKILEAAMNRLAFGARVVLCGSISEYTMPAPFGLTNYANLRRVNGMMKGFFVYNYLDRFEQSIATLSGWMRTGRMRSKLDLLDGIDKMPEALMRLYDGKNFGVQCCRVRRGPHDADR